MEMKLLDSIQREIVIILLKNVNPYFLEIYWNLLIGLLIIIKLNFIN